MASRRDLARPESRVFWLELRRLAKRADYPVVGREAILAWFHAHGFTRRDGSPVSWNQVLDWQWRCGEPMGWHSPAIGAHRGKPVSTHLLLLRWCMVQAEKLGPPTTQHWVPAPRAVRARRQCAGTRSNPGTGCSG